VVRFSSPDVELERLARRLELAMYLHRGGEPQLAVLAVEVHPKVPTETIEPAEAERLDRTVRDRIVGVLEATDSVARAGPLRYVVLVERADQGSFAMRAADDIVTVIRRPIAAREGRTPLVASIGISVFPDDGDRLTELLPCAEAAQQAARMGGGDLFGFYSGSMSDAAARRLAIERALPEAVERQQFTLAYQPQLDSRDGTLVGVEALLRWSHPKLGPIPPQEFVSVLESLGLIEAAGQWVLTEACRQAAEWSQHGRLVKIAVNTSAHQLRSPDFEGHVRAALLASGIAPTQLELELTETVLLEDEPHVREALASLRRDGVQVALDDFGTGYASLAYLRQFPMDTIKIDRQFVRGLPVDAMNAAITSAIVAMARCLQLDVVAEGIETEAEEEFLHSLHCFVLQGFRYAEPMSARDLDEWLKARPWA
jgi:EAL domain-containing protein (putative c-di-GMP-specific phosphodiesterase class I)